MDENQTPGTEAEVPASAEVVAEVPNVSAPAVAVSDQPVTDVPAAGAEVATIAKSELAHVFDAFEHYSLMEGISRLYALAKKHL